MCFCDRQDASVHDGDWNYYKQQAHEQKGIIGQLASLLETYGYHLPTVSRKPRASPQGDKVTLYSSSPGSKSLPPSPVLFAVVWLRVYADLACLCRCRWLLATMEPLS